MAQQELAKVVVYASLFFIVLNNIHRRESPTVISICLIVLCMALSWLAVYQFATKARTVWGVPRWPQFLNRGGATYNNPDHFADLLAMLIPVALAYVVMSRLKAATKFLLVYCAVAMLAGVGVSGSRGGILATAAALVVFCVVLLFQRKLWIPALGILVGLVALGIAFGTEFETVQKRFLVTFTQSGQLNDPRVGYWSAAINIFKEHPLWGAGPGYYESGFIRYRPEYIQSTAPFAHNDYLNTLSDWGAAGLSIVLLACALLFYGAWQTWRAFNQSNPEEGRAAKSDRLAFLVGACVGLVAILLHCVVDFNMHIPANAIMAVTLMALISSHWRFATERFWVDPRSVGRIVLTLAIGGAMFWLTLQDVHSGSEAYWMWRTEDPRLSPTERAAALEKAYEAEPKNFGLSYTMGEYYRLWSRDSDNGTEEHAREAMDWYAKSMALNPLDPWPPIGYGICLDWIGQTNQAEPYFTKAAKLDPNSYLVTYYVGTHFVQTGDYDSALFWLKRSMAIHWNDPALYALNSLKERMNDPYHLYKK